MNVDFANNAAPNSQAPRVGIVLRVERCPGYLVIGRQKGAKKTLNRSDARPLGLGDTKLWDRPRVLINF